MKILKKLKQIAIGTRDVALEIIGNLIYQGPR
jgi:hypothetical protein